MQTLTVTVENITASPNAGGYYSVLADGIWYSAGKVPLSCNKGDTVEICFESNGKYNNLVAPLKIKNGQKVSPRYATPVGGGNIGMQVGACLNNAVSLCVAGIITKESLLSTVLHLMSVGDTAKATYVYEPPQNQQQPQQQLPQQQYQPQQQQQYQQQPQQPPNENIPF